MSVRYIGSKNRLVGQIVEILGKPSIGERFVDGFCGTGAVAAGASAFGWPVHVNDQLLSAVCIACARIASEEQAPFWALGDHTQAVALLNACAPVEGFIWREYSPASLRFTAVERKYFTENNAMRIDAMRAQISAWNVAGLVSELEERILIADLLEATNRIANISGTYGCYLSTMSDQSREVISVRPRRLSSRTVRLGSSVGDAAHLSTTPADVYYLDPPYTKRQYAAYYHILETIAYGDAPMVTGKTGLRPWRDKASDFCHKRRALATFEKLLSGIIASRILISYSSEGHVELDPLKDMLRTFGTVAINELGFVGRYRPNKKASRAAVRVSEYVLDLRKAPLGAAPRRAYA